jgi:hypothetical protein
MRLQHAYAEEMVPLVHQVLVAGQPRAVKLTADPRTNSLIVTGDRTDLTAVKELVASLDVPVAKSQPSPTGKSVTFELVLMMIDTSSEAAQSLARTSTGAIDSTNPDAALAKLRDGLGKGGVTELAKLAISADEGRPWKSHQSVQIPMVGDGKTGPRFGGYSEAETRFEVAPATGKDGVRRLMIGCHIEQFASRSEAESDPAPGAPPAKQSSHLDFTTTAEDGKLVMAAVESGFGGSFVLFVRVK